jgi:hypothetical protein
MEELMRHQTIGTRDASHRESARQMTGDGDRNREVRLQVGSLS